MAVGDKITEWEFTAEVAGWIAVILDQDKTLPFSEAKCEQRGKGSRKRRDRTLIDKNGNKAITGEVKLPFAKDGATPFNEDVVQDARKKAARAKVNYFFTWNGAEMTRRLAAIILLQPKLNENYEKVKSSTYDWPKE